MENMHAKREEFDGVIASSRTVLAVSALSLRSHFSSNLFFKPTGGYAADIIPPPKSRSLSSHLLHTSTIDTSTRNRLAFLGSTDTKQRRHQHLNDYYRRACCVALIAAACRQAVSARGLGNCSIGDFCSRKKESQHSAHTRPFSSCDSPGKLDDCHARSRDLFVWCRGACRCL